MELPLQPGETSPPFSLTGASPPPGPLHVAGRYLVLGFEHILPLGLDHILFVLGLFLLSTRLRPLLWQVTAFTVAHTLTLALAVHGVVSLPRRPVESLIALSIAYVAIENVIVTEMKPWRPAVVFTFGLLHGLGFAGALTELGLPRGRLLPALLSFNVGVELGQIFVLLLILPATALLFRTPTAARFGIVITSVVVAHTAWHWMVERAQSVRAADWPELGSEPILALGAATLAIAVLAAAAWLALRYTAWRHSRSERGPS